MELILYNQGIFNIKSDAVSPGCRDAGKIDQVVLEDIVARLWKTVSFIGKSDYESLTKNRFLL